MGYYRRGPNEEDTQKAHERFRDLVWTAVERFQPEMGVARYGFTSWREELLWGPQVTVRLCHEGQNGWRIVFDRGWNSRRVKALALDKLSVDEFCMVLQGQVLVVHKQTEEHRRAELAREEAKRLYTDLKERAAQLLGFPLKTEDTSRGFPYMTLDLTPVESEGIVRFQADAKWRGLTVQQVQRLRALLQEERAPGADPTFLPGYPNDPPKGA